MSGRALINARQETVLELPTFRRALVAGPNARRCAVPATGFYEWHKPLGGRTGDPFLVRRRRGESAIPTMFMAGIYDIRPGEDSREATFVIMTTPACKEFSWLHDRQPCFLDSPQEIDDWLDATRVSSQEAVVRLLRTQDGLSCKRMLSDLSQEATNQVKPKAQLEITRFFAPKKPKIAGSAKPDEKEYNDRSRPSPSFSVGSAARSTRTRNERHATPCPPVLGKSGKIAKRPRVTKTNRSAIFKGP